MNLDEILRLTAQRESGFRLMVNHLKTINNPLIIETGCTRNESLAGDGWSTVIWDKFITENSGTAISIDNNEEHVNFARLKVSKLNVVVSDSVKFLYDKSKEDICVDLLYLDSYDYIPGLEHESKMHHILELACINSKIKPGGLVAVDDCWVSNGVREGKGAYVHKFMESLGKELVHDSWQLIWRW
jgi:predicted O-methyltransferase YrrM